MLQKAIDECEKDWAQNKKLIDISKKSIRNCVPKGFPYFSVDFGLQGGFAHVIEEEHSFPWYFGQVSSFQYSSLISIFSLSADAEHTIHPYCRKWSGV